MKNINKHITAGMPQLPQMCSSATSVSGIAYRKSVFKPNESLLPKAQSFINRHSTSHVSVGHYY